MQCYIHPTTKLQDGGIVSRERLHKIAKENTAVRCGETTRDNPKLRRGEYSRDSNYQDRNYIMYTCKTENVKKSENDLLNIKDWPRNTQTSSNADKKSGYVYVICTK